MRWRSTSWLLPSVEIHGNRISIESPIGKALRGHRVGDRVEVKVNDDYSYYLVIKSIDKTGSEDEEIRGF